MCKLCNMMNPENNDIEYAESDHWLCAGDKETGNPYVIYKHHYNDEINEKIRTEAKMMFNLLKTKYWSKIKLDVQGKTYPHVHLILSEVANEKSK